MNRTTSFNLIALLSFAWGSSATSQTIVDAADYLLTATNKYVAQVPLLDNALIGVKAHEDNFYFAPQPVVDWEKFSNAVSDACTGVPSDAIARVDMQVLFYSPALLAEIASVGNIPIEKLQPVPAYGYTFFVEDSNQVANQVDTNVDPTVLRKGETLASSRDLEPNRYFRLTRRCDFLQDIASAKQAHISYHAVGQQFSKSSISAELLMGQEIDTFFDLSDEQKETDLTVVNVTADGGGLGIDLGPIKIGKSSGSTTTTAEEQKFRVVSRDWVSDRAQRVVKTLNVEEVCQEDVGCADGPLIDEIVAFVLSDAKRVTARMEKVAEDTYNLTVGTTDVGPAILNVDETTKGALKGVYDASTETEAEVSYQDFKAKAKKDSANKLELDGSTEFTKTGEDWVPTSMELYLVDYSGIESQTNASYTKTVLKELEKASFGAPQAVLQGANAGFIERNFLDEYLGLQVNLESTQRDRRAWIKKYRSAKPTGHYLVQGQGRPQDAKHYYHVKCPQNGGPTGDKKLAQWADANICKQNKRLTSFKRLSTRGGGTCGYKYVSFACMPK